MSVGVAGSGGRDDADPIDAGGVVGGAGGARDSGPLSDASVAGSGGAGTGGNGGTGSGGSGSGGSGSGGSGGRCGQPPNVPLEGFWEEVAQITCLGTEEPPAEKIQELHFALSSISLDKQLTGRISVTWTAFETFIDYSGTFVGRGAQNGSLSFQIEGSTNYRPEDVDADGYFEHCNDELILRDVWLGTARNMAPSLVPMCGHRFRKLLRSPTP